MSNSYLSGTDGLTAHAGGTQVGALPLQSQINRISTVATAADSVMLPPAVAGSMMYLINSGANSMQVFGTGSDTINGVASGTGVAQAAAAVTLYICPKDGTWYSK